MGPFSDPYSIYVKIRRYRAESFCKRITFSVSPHPFMDIECIFSDIMYEAFEEVSYVISVPKD